jgi:hypothetical protein
MDKKTLLKHLNILKENKRYEDFLLLFLYNYNILPDFFEIFERMSSEEKKEIMMYITGSKTPASSNLNKILNSAYFYNAIKIDNFLR